MWVRFHKVGNTESSIMNKNQDKLTDHSQVSHSGLGLCSIDLAHVGSRIRPLHIANMQIPCTAAFVRNSDSGISRYDGFVDSQDGAAVVVDPCDLVPI